MRRFKHLKNRILEKWLNIYIYIYKIRVAVNATISSHIQLNSLKFRFVRNEHANRHLPSYLYPRNNAQFIIGSFSFFATKCGLPPTLIATLFSRSHKLLRWPCHTGDRACIARFVVRKLREASLHVATLVFACGNGRKWPIHLGRRR